MSTETFTPDDLVFSPAELEFFAENEPIDIVPNFSFDNVLPETNGCLKCIGGTYGPFRPNHPTTVPLWLALALCKRKKCRILVPEWLSCAKLQGALDKERVDSAVFENLEYRFSEVAKLLLQEAGDAFSDLVQTRDLVNMVEKVRLNKLKSGLKALSGSETIRLPRLGSYELNMVRQFFTGAMDQFQDLERVRDEAARSHASSTGDASRSMLTSSSVS